jgi:hypothetical protein
MCADVKAPVGPELLELRHRVSNESSRVVTRSLRASSAVTSVTGQHLDLDLMPPGDRGPAGSKGALAMQTPLGFSRKGEGTPLLHV